MVDLVKIRRKAREKKEAEKDAERASEESAGGAGEKPPQKKSGGRRKSSKKEPQPPAPESTESSAGAAGPAPPAESATAGAVGACGTAGSVQPAEEPPRASDRLEEFRRTAGIGRADAGEGEKGESAAEEDRLELLVFQLAGEQYAVEIERIQEIIRPRAVTRVPNAGREVVGIISLRGTIVTILDVRLKLGHPSAAAGDTSEESRFVVVNHEGEGAGFLVDRVYRVVAVDAAAVEPHPVVTSNEQSRCIRGVFRHRDRITIVLWMDELLSRGM